MEHHQKKNNYRPLIILITVIILAAFALELSNPEFNPAIFANYFMGLFFVIFAAFKLFDLNGFADGFQRYDIIAKSQRKYAYAYPFIELGLGLLYLSNSHLFFTNLITLILMIVSAIGVIQSVTKGQKIKCACLGTALDVPLSTISIVENIGMGIMALGMLMFNI